MEREGSMVCLTRQVFFGGVTGFLALVGRVIGTSSWPHQKSVSISLPCLTRLPSLVSQVELHSSLALLHIAALIRT